MYDDPKQQEGESLAQYYDRFFDGHYPPNDLLRTEKQPMPKLQQADKPLSPKLQEA